MDTPTDPVSSAPWIRKVSPAHWRLRTWKFMLLRLFEYSIFVIFKQCTFTELLVKARIDVLAQYAGPMKQLLTDARHHMRLLLFFQITI